MKIVSFDPFRTLHLPGVSYLKPEHWLARSELLLAADWVLFPGAWQLDVLEYVFRCRVFPSPATLRLGFDKVVMTRAMQAAFPALLPETLILPNTPAGQEETLGRLELPFVVKAPRDSMGRGVKLVRTRSEFLDWCCGQPLIYAQRYLPVQRDLRVVWVGDSVVGAYWRINNDGFLNNVAQGGRIDFDDIPAAALDAVAMIARRFGIDHAGFDIAWLDGEAQFFEFNVLFGNQALNARGLRIEPFIHDWLLRHHEDPAPLPRSA